MRKKAEQTGVEFHDLSAMKSRSIFMLVIALALAFSSAWVVFIGKSKSPTFIVAAEIASDAFDLWEQPGSLPEGVYLQDSTHAVVTKFVRSVDSTALWHSSVEPFGLSAGLEKSQWRGGWFFGSDLSAWEEKPGRMASHWKPRVGGANRLQMSKDGAIVSVYAPFDSTSADQYLKTTWISIDSVAQFNGVLPNGWMQWFEYLLDDHPEILQAKLGAFSLPGWPEYAVTKPLLDAAWIQLELDKGDTLWAFHCPDSAAFVANGIGNWSNGVWYLHSRGEENGWDSLPAFQKPNEAAVVTSQFAQWNSGDLEQAKWLADGRLIWMKELQPREDKDEVIQLADVVAISEDTSSIEVPETTNHLLGQARNHRTGNLMDIRWESGVVQAIDSKTESIIWTLKLGGSKAPKVWEVDLYQNGKFQVVIASKNRVDVIDVLGREVKGYPQLNATGFTAAAVFDYDRNNRHRIVLGTRDGNILNLQGEAMPTAGWMFSPNQGRYAVDIQHVRAGPSDYLFVAFSDGSVRLLARSGEDRMQTSIRIPPDQIAAFRIGKDIESTTALYIDENGWVEEKTIGGNESVGLTHATKGIRVLVEDRTKDGIPEVIVLTESGEEMWNARNERIN